MRKHKVKAGLISALFLCLCAVFVCVVFANINHGDNSTNSTENLGNLETSAVPNVLASERINDITNQNIDTFAAGKINNEISNNAENNNAENNNAENNNHDTTNNKNNVVPVSAEINNKLQNGEVVSDENGNKFANYGGLHGDVVDTNSNVLKNNVDATNANFFGPLLNAPQNDTTIYWKYDASATTLYLKSSQDEGYSLYKTIAGVPAWNIYMASAKTVYIEDEISPSNISYFFTPVSKAGYGPLSKIETINGLENLDMTSVQNADFAFAGLEKANLGDSGLNVSSVTSAICMFQYAAVNDDLSIIH